jgi:hypothetical protein
MANYLFNNKKKRSRLARLEQELARSIQGEDSRDRQLHLADEIRLARIRVLRAEQSNLDPRAKDCSDRTAALDKQIASLEMISSEKIFAEFIRRGKGGGPA